MNDITKVKLIIALKGSVMFSEQECSENPKRLYDEFMYTVKDERKKFHTIKGYLRKDKYAKQVISLTEEQYKGFISNETPPFSTPKVWNRMNKTERLKAHFQNYCESIAGGVYYNYILDED